MRRHSSERKQEEAEMEEPWGQILRFTRPTWKFALQNEQGRLCGQVRGLAMELKC